MNLLSRGYEVLKEDGIIHLLYKTSRYFNRRIYWLLKNEYTLSVNDINITFSAPNFTTVGRNKSRFKLEQKVISDVLHELDGDTVFYDVGANTGIYTLFAAETCSEVVAFEPYHPNAQLLRRDLIRNNISNVKLCELALSDVNGQVSFNQPDGEDIGYGGSSIVNVGGENANSTEIPTRRGDDLITERNFSSPNVVKIDVEGSEDLVIDGLENNLSAPTCNLIYCELHHSLYNSSGDLD